MAKCAKCSAPQQRQLAKLVKAALGKYKRLFELPDWPAFFVMEHEPLDEDAVASISVGYENLEVFLHVSDTLKPEAVDRVMCHEIIHWVMSNLSEYLRHVLDDSQYKYAKYLEEQIVENLTIAIIRPNRRKPTDVNFDRGEPK